MSGRMVKRMLILAVAFATCMGALCAPKRTANTIRQQKVATQREINETNKKIKDNNAKTLNSLNTLNSITAEIGEQQRSIDILAKQLDGINQELKKVNDSIAANEQVLSDMRKEYGNAIRRIHSHSSSLDKLQFLFMSESFHQALRRMRYLREFSAWRKRQSQEITDMQKRLESSRERINSLATSKSNTIKDQNLAKLTLEQKKQQQAGVVADLRAEGSALRSVLAEKKRKAAALDRELERMIEQERRAAEKARQEEERRRKSAAESKTPSKAKSESTVSPKNAGKSESREADISKPGKLSNEEVVLGGSFESNKGRLPYPVTGNFKIVRHFGVQRHPELQYVMTENGGIDIETRPGAVARAIFSGKVSAIFRQDGYNTVVMIRHGQYLTIYVNLTEIYVRTGETVKPNQNIGKIFSDREDDNRTILHFEVRKEKAKLNPELWLRR